MFKLVLLFRKVDDTKALETFFSGTVLPIGEQLEGLQRTEVSRVTGKPGGDSRFHLALELYFESDRHFFRAVTSPVGLALRQAMEPWLAARLASWFYAESWTEAVTSAGSESYSRGSNEVEGM